MKVHVAASGTSLVLAACSARSVRSVAHSDSDARWFQTSAASATKTTALTIFFVTVAMTLAVMMARSSSAAAATIATLFIVSTVIATIADMVGTVGDGSRASADPHRAPSVVDMTDQHAVNLTPQGPPRTVLSPADATARHELAQALGRPDPDRREAVARVVAANPRMLEAWAALGDLGRDTVERYACYRIGYHRGLDALRASGWRGSGYVRWADETNRGFLRSLRGLRDMADLIGERDEAERCSLFLQQLDPSGVPDHG